jgi:hypothetical protein
MAHWKKCDDDRPFERDGKLDLNDVKFNPNSVYGHLCHMWLQSFRRQKGSEVGGITCLHQVTARTWQMQ